MSAENNDLLPESSKRKVPDVTTPTKMHDRRATLILPGAGGKKRKSEAVYIKILIPCPQSFMANTGKMK
ncbi:MAG: hypothetical protein GY941_19515 [Planctomycetes bacterium]|nr:hypothetical protein [Planctomycetota bacterium]